MEMHKVTILVLALVGLAVHGKPLGSGLNQNELPTAVAQVNWDEVQRIMAGNLERLRAAPRSWEAGDFPSQSDIRNLRPANGWTVQGESQYTFKSVSNINGQVKEDKGGHRVINDNGRVTEYDIQPKK